MNPHEVTWTKMPHLTPHELSGIWPTRVTQEFEGALTIRQRRVTPPKDPIPLTTWLALPDLSLREMLHFLRYATPVAVPLRALTKMAQDAAQRARGYACVPASVRTQAAIT